jgi:Ferritin-like
MPAVPDALSNPSREMLVHALYEAAELEHNLMCTYLYAAFGLKAGEEEGLRPDKALAVAHWRREIIAVAIDEMSHLTAVWNITSALGGVPHQGLAQLHQVQLQASTATCGAASIERCSYHLIRQAMAHMSRAAHDPDEPTASARAIRR